MTFRDLPTVNACLNSLTTVLLITGFLLIRRKKREAHQKVMTAAIVTSALFLVSYLVYHFEAGSVKFTGQGPVRTVYLAILLTHTLLAMAVAPLALTVFVLGRTKRFELHKKLARITWPLWIYVSITGVVIYWMLYRMTW